MIHILITICYIVILVLKYPDCFKNLNFNCRVHEKLRKAEIREGASFDALFGSALCLGIISRRRVYFETIKYEKERNAGFLSPFGYSAATVAAAVDSVCSKEVVFLYIGAFLLLLIRFDKAG